MKVRPIHYEDFVQSLTQIRPSVAMEKIRYLEEWSKIYGIGPTP